eukprot:TRINITY_DN886_c0_g1_i1.p1 TRINITY_DN886_c0_g1~~TRINITY_DN886_c0_g1_i1.p1  ORF type:complete len:253 (-),score=35.72 TRINITY_DN886_c0_g1_i1:142-900(-)
MCIRDSCKPWVRNNRIQRDIPTTWIIGGNKVSNLRQIIQIEMKKRGLKCMCIRCREVGRRRSNRNNISKADEKEIERENELGTDVPVKVVRDYEASNGHEYFISYETTCDEQLLFGFIRLRLSDQAGAGVQKFEELKGCALIRELHVYGQMRAVGTQADAQDTSQHYGFGTKLLNHAEELCREKGWKKLAVIAGVGVKNYYRKRGFKDGQYYLIKDIPAAPISRSITTKSPPLLLIGALLVVFLAILALYFS